jgi:hypothetical protein
MAKKSKTQDKGYAERIEHVEATRPEPWPGIPGRSEEHDAEPSRDAGSGSEESARRGSDSTEAQRQLEREMHEPTRR